MSTVKYVIRPKVLYEIVRVTATEDAQLHEEVALLSVIDDARQTARALTAWHKENPDDKSQRVIEYGEEMH